jgi:hypothetical protein
MLFILRIIWIQQTQSLDKMEGFMCRKMSRLYSNQGALISYVIKVNLPVFN